MKKCHNKECPQFNAHMPDEYCITTGPWNCKYYKLKKKKRCEWKYERTGDDCYVSYNMSCNSTFYGYRHEADLKKDHKYCPYCGKKIKYIRG